MFFVWTGDIAMYPQQQGDEDVRIEHWNVRTIEFDVATLGHSQTFTFFAHSLGRWKPRPRSWPHYLWQGTAIRKDSDFLECP
jgi:hypothetical protein